MKNLENKDKKRKGLTLSKEKTYQLVCTLWNFRRGSRSLLHVSLVTWRRLFVSFESVTDEFAFSVTCVEMIQLCGYTNESQLKVMEWMGNIKQYRNHVWIVFILPPRYRRLIVLSGKYEPTTQKNPQKQKTFEKTNKKSVKWMVLYALINLLYCFKKNRVKCLFFF